MEMVLKNVRAYRNDGFTDCDILIKDGVTAAIAKQLRGDVEVDMDGAVTLPGFADAHVHLREPGFEYKETIRTGTLAAARGGYTAICAMPNVDPVPDSLDTLNVELDRINRGAVIDVRPYGAITRGESGTELSDMTALAPYVCGFSDDGRGVQDADVMRLAMTNAKKLDKIIAAHCEDLSVLPKGWSVHDGAAERFGLVGNPSESEWRQVARDLDLVRETGCGYHVCHVSTKESISLIRLAKAEGLDVTCETAPHYIALCDSDLRDEGRFRMNPPIRSAEDMDAIIGGLCDGTIDMIATDHAPHSAEEKRGGLRDSLNGIVGLECAFPVLYTELVRGGVMPFERLVELFTFAVKRFALPENAIEVGNVANLTIFDINCRYEIDSSRFLSMGRATPFEGWPVYGRCLLTMYDGKVVWRDENRIRGGQL